MRSRCGLHRPETWADATGACTNLDVRGHRTPIIQPPSQNTGCGLTARAVTSIFLWIVLIQRPNSRSPRQSCTLEIRRSEPVARVSYHFLSILAPLGEE